MIDSGVYSSFRMQKMDTACWVNMFNMLCSEAGRHFSKNTLNLKKINRDHKLCGQQLAQTFSYAWFIFQNVTLWKLVKRLEIDAKARAWVFLCYALFKSTTRAINLLTVRRVDVMFGLAHVSHKYVIDDYSFSNALSRALRMYWWVPRYTHTPTMQNQIEIWIKVHASAKFEPELKFENILQRLLRVCCSLIKSNDHLCIHPVTQINRCLRKMLQHFANAKFIAFRCCSQSCHLLMAEDNNKFVQSVRNNFGCE